MECIVTRIVLNSNSYKSFFYVLVLHMALVLRRIDRLIFFEISDCAAFGG